MGDTEYQIVASLGHRPEVNGLWSTRRDDSAGVIGPGKGAIRLRQSVPAGTRDWRADA